MAKYNREFLVPYLQNICALHLAERKIFDYDVYLTRKELALLNGGKSIAPPRPPLQADSFLGTMFLIGGFSCVFLGFVIMLILELPLFGLLILFAGIPMLIYSLLEYANNKQTNEESKEAYQKKLAEYQAVQAKYEKDRSKKLPGLQTKIKACTSERKTIENLLQQAYSANIIPSRYRNIYAAVYLYDWFSTSQADDLDMALSMFVLEEIKEKLDIIIANQSEIILNQRMMLANQQKSLEQQQQHSAMMRAKLNRIAASNEERNIYLSMIESNTAATAYFAAADYIRNL